MFVWKEAAADFVAEYAEEHVLADLDGFVEANLEDILDVLRARGYEVKKVRHYNKKWRRLRE